MYQVVCFELEPPPKKPNEAALASYILKDRVQSNGFSQARKGRRKEKKSKIHDMGTLVQLISKSNASFGCLRLTAIALS
jgi:hypothetical protein